MYPDTDTTAATPTPAEVPTVDGLCREFARAARRLAGWWGGKFPHLVGEFESAANFGLFTAARSYVSRGPDMWSQMPFMIWLRICIDRKCQAAVGREKVRHPLGFTGHATNSLTVVADRCPPFDEAIADADETWNDIETAVGLLDVLDEDRRELFLRHHADGVTISALARELGVHRSTVSYHMQSAMRKVLAFADATKF